MKSSTLILAIGLVILLNAGFSMLQCNKNNVFHIYRQEICAVRT